MANASYLRLTKSETRDLADREYRNRLLGRFHRSSDTTDEWRMSNTTFFVAFVVIAALLTILALVL
jgi:hypothetical protein